MQTKKFQSPFFEEINDKKIDPRCDYINKYVKKNLIKYEESFSKYEKFLKMWAKIEKA